MTIVRFLQTVRDEHRKLPRSLRVWLIIPGIAIFVIFTGLVFTLPPGPLCDEGMVLFMEGGCDWGESNVFFFSKLGLLLGINFAFVVAWLSGVRSIQGFLPHLVVLGVLAVLPLSDPKCDTYYGHPNGSIAQMNAEAAGFSVAGIALLRRFKTHPRRLLVPLILAWNGFHIGIFYLGLTFTHHWTWLHTAWVAVTLSLLGYCVA